MTTRYLTVQHQTSLAVNIIIKDDTGTLALTLLLTTQLFALLWQMGRVATSVIYEMALVFNDFKIALDFSSTIFAIAFRSLMYGLGVRI